MREIISYWQTSPNLVGWWRFNERQGSILNDYSYHFNSGIISGLAPSAWTSAKGLNFDSSIPTDIQLPNFNYFNNSEEIYSPLVTISCWVNPATVAPSAQTLFGDFSNGGGTFVFQLANSNVQVVYNFGAGYSILTSATNLFVGNLYMITSTYDFNNIRLYINGIEDINSPLNYTNGFMNGAPPFFIGSRTDLTNAYSGYLSDMRIYNIALQSGQINALYKQGPA
jgi:hypothetical protein